MNILLIGGSKSGKSLLAQEVTHRLAAGGPLYYWATMEPADGEDRALPPATGRWNPLASCYLLVARKEVFTVTPVRPAFRRRPRLVGGLVNPTTRIAA